MKKLLLILLSLFFFCGISQAATFTGVQIGGISTAPDYQFYQEKTITDQVSNNDLTCTSAGATGYLDELNGYAFVSVAATEVLNIPKTGLTSHPNFEQFLTVPLIPANQTTASLGVGEYFLDMRGGGSVAVSANSATITNAGSATEGTGVNFQVTGAGTVDVVITGACTHFQLTDGMVSLYPIFNNTVSSIASRAGTIRAADLAGDFPKLKTALEGSFKMSGGWTPGVDYVDVGTTEYILGVRSTASLLYLLSSGRIRIYDGTNTLTININYISGTPYPWEIVAGYNTALSANKMQLNVYVSGAWQSEIADYDGSFNPKTDLTFGLSNAYQSSVKDLKCEDLKQSHWR